MATDTIYLRLRSYDHHLIDELVGKIVEIQFKNNFKMCGPIFLPVKIKRFTLLKSVFVHKKSKEHFEIRLHYRLIKFEVNENLDMSCFENLPVSPKVEVKLVRRIV